MGQRKGLSKKIRFEVFKRDSFTCQYCGGQAPEVVLCVDHINPVAGGGENDILNLVTSCEPCNAGKGARKLDDNSVIAKQKAQLDELNRRREQLEMMLQWREAIANIDEDYVSAFDGRFNEETRCGLTEHGRKKVRGWLKKYNLNELLDALEDSFATYYKGGDEDDPDRNNEMAGKALNMVPRILGSRKLNVEKPWMKDLFYTRAIIRNRMYCNERVAIDLLEQLYHLGANIEEMKDWAKTARNWTNWRRGMEEWIEDLEFLAQEGPR